MTKSAETDTPLFGTQSDVLETAARSPIPSTSNTTTAAPETKSNHGDFFSSAASSSSTSEPSKSTGTGARNENSALFSLAQLSGSPEDKPAERKPSSDSVIDIKALAQGAPALSAILGDGGGIASPLAGPVLAPVPAPTLAAATVESKSGTNKTVLFSVLGSSLILVGGGLGAAMIMRSAPTRGAHTSSNATPSTATPGLTDTIAGANANSAGSAANAAETPSSPTARSPGHGSSAHNTRPSESNARSSRSSRSSASSARATQEAPVQLAAPPTQPTTPTVSPCVRNCRGDISCILRCQSGGGGSAVQPASSSSSTGSRDSPTRSEVMAAMSSVRSAVVACAAGTHGTGVIADRAGAPS